MINFNTIFQNSFIQIYESLFFITIVAFSAGIIIMYLYNTIYFEYRYRRKLQNLAIPLVTVPLIYTTVYLIIKDKMFILGLLLYFIITYFLYSAGFFDNIFEKWSKLWN